MKNVHTKTNRSRERLARKVATEVRRIRNHAGLTQAQLAKLVGTSQPQIARIESGKYYGTTVRSLCWIAVACNARLEISFV